MNDLVSVQQIAAVLKCSERTVRNMRDQDRLPSPAKGTTLFDAEDLELWTIIGRPNRMGFDRIKRLLLSHSISKEKLLEDD